MSNYLRTLSNTYISLKDIGVENAVKNPSDALGQILNLVYFWAGIIAVLIIVIAGYLFVTARGDAAQIKRGKDAIRGAVIGLVVIFMAFVITQFVLGRF